MKPTSASPLRIRQAHFADNRWYNSSSSTLETDIQNHLSNPPFSLVFDKLIGLVAPHAGHFFSGHVAGAAFAGLTPGLFEVVILLGPDHHGLAPGEISTVNAHLWRTPLGDIPVAWDILKALEPEIDLKLLPRDDEHSLEIDLPFLHMTLRQFKLVPLMMGTQSAQMCRKLASALVKAIRNQFPPQSSLEGGTERGVLFVASSDLSHYFDDDTARQLDEATLQFILNLDADGLLQHIEMGRSRGEPFACGAGPIATVIHAAQALGATQASLLKYATSADVYPDKSRVVGYAAVAFSN